jgi:hypothetical protein
MQVKIRLSVMAVVALLVIILGSVGAAFPADPPAPGGQQSGVFVQQVPQTPYMASQVGTPNELSPLAPANAKNVRKVGDQWLCDLNGQVMVFNGGSSCWEPKR